MNRAEEPLPNYERVIFSNSAIELCLIQLKYPPIQRFTEESYMIGIKEVLANEYPLVNNEKGMNIVITPQGVSQTPGASMLRFTSIDSRWSVLLASEFVSLETREYTHFDEFSARFISILRNVITHFHLRHQLRIGLRYINEFRHPEGDNFETWHHLLNENLLGLSANTIFGGQIKQTIGEILTHRDDGHLLVRHGFLKGSTVAPTSTHPMKTEAFYLLDLDYYDDTPVTLEVEAIDERIKRYNEFLYRVFRWSIGTNELYLLLK